MITRTLEIDIYDLDSCFLVRDPATKNLSKDLIALATRPFFIMTHRSIWGITKESVAKSNFYQHCRDLYGYNLDYFLTRCVKKNIEDAVGKECLGVSTADDNSPTAPNDVAEKCGYGYKQFIEPYEASLIERLSKDKYDFDYKFPAVDHRPLDVKEWNEHTLHKNSQLLHIIHKLKKDHGDDVKLVLRYFDDDLRNLLATKRLELPKNVVLHCYLHSPVKHGIKAELHNPMHTVQSISVSSTAQLAKLDAKLVPQLALFKDIPATGLSGPLDCAIVTPLAKPADPIVAMTKALDEAVQPKSSMLVMKFG